MTRSYTETEKLGTMLMALEHGVPVAVEQRNVPERTIYQWFEQAGGLTEIRKVSDEARIHAIAEAGRALCVEVTKRVGKLSDDDLMITYRKLLEAEATPSGAGIQAGAQAAAKSELHLHIGEDEIIVPREDEA